MIYFTSDLHLGHNKSFIYENRGFKTIEEHDTAVVKKWNQNIDKNDVVYVLGDLVMGDILNAEKYLSKLNGKIKIILGNHDSENKIKMYKNLKLEIIGYAYLLNYRDIKLYLSHYPTLTGNFDDMKTGNPVINLAGHTHNKNKWVYKDHPFMYNVSMDAHNMRCVSIDEILEDISLEYDKIAFEE